MSKGGKQLEGKVKKAEGFDMEDIEEVLEDVEPLPPAVQRRVNAMKNIHKEYISLERKYKEEIAALDLKYEKLYAPLYLKQNAIALGEHEPTDAEAHIEGEDPAVDSEKPEEDIKGVPKFWLTVLKNNPSIGETITENDEDALSFIKDIKCTLYENSKGFEITFHFAENPYFTDTVLTKKYFLEWDDGIYADAVYDHSEGSTINWKQGKNLTIKLIKKQQKSNKGGKGKKGGASRVSVVEEPCDSFFHFFSTLPKPEEGEEEEGALDSLEQDFEIGCIIKDKLIPHSVLWFTAEALDYEEEDFEDYDDFDFEGEEGEEGEEEEEEEEEKPRKNPRTGKKGGDGGKGFQLQPPSGHNGPAQPQQPECKQQ